MTENDIIEAYQNKNLSLSAIGNLNNLSLYLVRKILIKHGVKIKTNREWKKKYFFNENFFETINTEEKAYWVGFIAGDGCVSKKELIVSLHNKDIEHLQKLKVSLSATNKIHNRKAHKSCYKESILSRITFCSQKILNDLKQFNIIQNKTQSVRAQIGT